MRSRSIVRSIGAVLTMLAMALASLVVNPVTSGAQETNPFQRGPDPTAALLNADSGPFSTSSVSVSSLVSGFGGGTIYYPNDTSQGTFGAIAFAPGYTASSASYTWMRRVASHGFVVFTINTDSRFDFPSSRATQLQNALNYLVNSSTSAVRSRIDPTRLAVGGHSMGGGGALIAADRNSSLQAAVPLQPWNTSTNFSGVDVPSMIVGAENDTIASVASHSRPFYNSIPAASEKALLVVNGASHGLGTTSDDTQALSSIAWYKRYVDNDTRYDQFLCPGPSGFNVEQYLQTCPS
jgi:dienelactone hydrolase